MLLSARILENVSNVNSFNFAQKGQLTEGDTPLVYFQLVDLSQDRADQGFSPAGRRYMPAVGATLSAILDNIDDGRRITRAATQPFANDPSIWAVQLQTTDKIRGTVNLKLALTESGKLTNGYLQAALSVVSSTGISRI